MTRSLFFAAFFLVQFILSAELSEPSWNTTLIPQTVYVGDRARLIVNLDSAAFASVDELLVEDRAELLPKTENVRVQRVELERRLEGARVLIDFTAFAPGTVALPAIELGTVRLVGLEVKIASVLDADTTDLEPSEGPLTAPGTYALIYGGIFFVVVAVVVVLLLAVRGVPLFKEYLERRKRNLAARSMRRVLGRLEADGVKMEVGVLLSVLFDELRSYLTYRTGLNCHALTPREFPRVLGGAPSGALFSEADLAFLENLFRHGDEVRFGSRPASHDELMDALRGVGELVDRTEAAAC